MIFYFAVVAALVMLVVLGYRMGSNPNEPVSMQVLGYLCGLMGVLGLLKWLSVLFVVPKPWYQFW